MRNMIRVRVAQCMRLISPNIAEMNVICFDGSHMALSYPSSSFAVECLPKSVICTSMKVVRSSPLQIFIVIRTSVKTWLLYSRGPRMRRWEGAWSGCTYPVWSRYRSSRHGWAFPRLEKYEHTCLSESHGKSYLYNHLFSTLHQSLDENGVYEGIGNLRDAWRISPSVGNEFFAHEGVP